MFEELAKWRPNNFTGSFIWFLKIATDFQRPEIKKNVCDIPIHCRKARFLNKFQPCSAHSATEQAAEWNLIDKTGCEIHRCLWDDDDGDGGQVLRLNWSLGHLLCRLLYNSTMERLASWSPKTKKAKTGQFCTIFYFSTFFFFKYQGRTNWRNCRVAFYNMDPWWYVFNRRGWENFST